MRGVRDMEKLAADVAAMPPQQRAQYERQLFWHRVSLDLESLPLPWRPISEAKKDGRLLLLLVDGSEATNRAAIEAEPNYIWSPNPLEDADVSRTLGHNSFENTGVDQWEFAGWCWSNDHYTEGHGTPIAFIELDQVAPAPAGEAADGR